MLLRLIGATLVFSTAVQAAPPKTHFDKYLDDFQYRQINRILPPEQERNIYSGGQIIESEVSERMVKDLRQYYAAMDSLIKTAGNISDKKRQEVMEVQVNRLSAIMKTPPASLTLELKRQFANQFYLLIAQSNGAINRRLSTQVKEFLPVREFQIDNDSAFGSLQTIPIIRAFDGSGVIKPLGLNVFLFVGIFELVKAAAPHSSWQMAAFHVLESALAFYGFYRLDKVTMIQAFEAYDRLVYALWQNQNLKVAIGKISKNVNETELSDAAQVRWFFNYFDEYFKGEIKEATEDLIVTKNLVCNVALEDLNGH